MHTRAMTAIVIVTLVSVLLWADGFRISQDGIRLSKNFFEVEKGQVYRSAQLTGTELEDVIRRYGIKTVLNLQGERPGYGWYDSEEKITKKYSAKLINLSMSTESIPQREHLLTMLDAFKNAPRPILIHCRSGSDRTGEAAAIYLMDHLHKSRSEALKMLSVKYWYFETFAPAKRYFVELYQGEDWARSVYDPCKQNYLYRDLRNCPSI